MKLQWKSVSEDQERRNSLLRGYRSLIGGYNMMESHWFSRRLIRKLLGDAQVARGLSTIHIAGSSLLTSRAKNNLLINTVQYKTAR